MKAKSKKTQLQQGDVLLSKVKATPEGCKKIKDKRGVVLAEGEHTGHYHGIDSGAIELLEAPDGTRFFVNSSNEPVTVTHQEHKPVTIDPGIWQVGQVREYDWFQQMERTVVD